MTSITGRGLLTNDGEDWLRQHRLGQPAFARPRMMALDEIVVPAASAMLERWKLALQNQTPLDIDREMIQLTLEVVGKALFSIDLSSEAHAMTGAVLTTLDHIVYRARNMVTPPAFLPTPRNLRFHRALALLDQAVYQMIASRKQSGDPGSNLLGMLLAARDQETGRPMNDQKVRDELVILSPYAVHRQPEYWQDASVFRPKRFLEKEAPGSQGLKHFAYIPFGAGPRICIGNQFAQVEGQLILAAIAQHFRLELTGPLPHTDALVTLRPHSGLPMRLILQNS